MAQNTTAEGASLAYPHLPLRVSEPEDRHEATGTIMVFDAANNDIAEFMHSDQALVGQTYDQALTLANAFVSALSATPSPAPRAPAVPGLGELRDAAQAVMDAFASDCVDGERQYPNDPAYNLNDKEPIKLTTGMVWRLRDALDALDALDTAPAAPAVEGGEREQIAEIARLTSDAERALATSSPAPAGEGDLQDDPGLIEHLAQHLHDEEADESVGGRGNGWTWPEHEGDTGYRGGGYVTITPTDALLRHREAATRIARCVTGYRQRAALTRPPARAVDVPAGDLRKAFTLACFDPGAVVGPRGKRDTDEWRADACLATLASRTTETGGSHDMMADLNRARAVGLIAARGGRDA